MFYNFDTGKMEEIPGNFECLEDSKVIEFLPKFEGMKGGGPARVLYQCHRLAGMSKLDALIKALELVRDK